MTEQEALKDIIEDGIELGAGDFVDVEALKAAAKALEKQVNSKWIPCSERLPEEGEVVLVQYEYKDEVEMAVGWSNRGYITCWDDRISGISNCVAWMPLPEPYKPQEQKEGEMNE